MITPNAVLSLSLVASFVAGMVALFAPCCVTFLLPAYFANVFKEKKQVLLMTLIYSLGIFTVMMPVVLGAKVLSRLFYDLHDQTYIVGGLFLILVAFLALFGVKLPMPHLKTTRQPGDPLSTYILGIFSGITSACCAPVLIGVMTLSALTFNVFQALLVGFAYVLGMVTPLYLASIFIDRRNILEKPIFRRVVFQANLGSKLYPILFSNLISFVMFAGIGLLLIFLSISGRLSMAGAEEQIAANIQSVAVRVTQMTAGIPFLDGLFVLAVILSCYWLFRKIKNSIN